MSEDNVKKSVNGATSGLWSKVLVLVVLKSIAMQTSPLRRVGIKCSLKIQTLFQMFQVFSQLTPFWCTHFRAFGFLSQLYNHIAALQ